MREAHPSKEKDFGTELHGTDRQIIEVLKANPQMTNKDLAGFIGVSQSTVAQRIRAMSERNLMRVVAQRDIFSDGYTLMCFADISVSGPVQSCADFLTGLPEVTSISRCLGASQLFVNFRAKDRYHLDDILTQKLGAAPGISRIRTNLCLRILKLETGYGDLSRPLPPAAMALSDDRDGAIQRMLLENARISNREIARQLDISEGSVRQRIKKLNDDKQMRIGVVCNPVGLNIGMSAVIRVATQPSHRAEVVNALMPRAEVFFVGATTGDYDLWTLVQTRGSQELADFCEATLSSASRVTDVIISPLVENYMHRYDLVRIR